VRSEAIRQVYGYPRSFESCAAVTELFLCASKDSMGLPNIESQCADTFLPDVLQLIQPGVIIAVGSRVMDYFLAKDATTSRSGQQRVKCFGRTYRPAKMPHPGNPKLSVGERSAQIQECARTLPLTLLPNECLLRCAQSNCQCVRRSLTLRSARSARAGSAHSSSNVTCRARNAAAHARPCS
jgi:hypothetical protein